MPQKTDSPARIYQAGDYTLGHHVALDARAVRHVLGALRLKVGDPIILFNGQGHSYYAYITACARQDCQLKISASCEENKESPLTTTLYQGVLRSNKMDFALQKAVELGVSQICPFISDHTSIKEDKFYFAKRDQHWQQVIISACEQCGRNQLPTLHPIQPLSDCLQTSLATKEPMLVFDPTGQGLSQATLARPFKALHVFLGPEGGFSARELVDCRDKAMTIVRFGPRILRAETASTVILGILQYCYGDCV